MRFDLDGHTFDGPEPAGKDGRALYARVIAALKTFGIEDILDEGGEREVRRWIGFSRLLGASPLGASLVDATFRGWTVDGLPFSLEAFDASGRWGEPYLAAIRVWTESGFFHVAAPPSPSHPSGDTGTD